MNSINIYELLIDIEEEMNIKFSDIISNRGEISAI